MGKTEEHKKSKYDEIRDKNRKLLFDNPNKKSAEIDNTILELIKSGANSSYIKKHLKLVGANEDYVFDFLILFLINCFTMNYSNINKLQIELQDYVNLINKFGEFSLDIGENGDYIRIINKRDGYDFIVMKLTDCLEGVSENIECDLETTDRHHKCHELSFKVSQYLGGENELVTCYCYGATEKSKYLHTIVETSIGGEDYVVDPTINAVIEKDGYYKMRHITFSDILSRIKLEDLISDLELYENEYKQLDIGLREYEVFRDEIIREFEKKKKEGFKL